MEFSIDDFVEAPTFEVLDRCRKEDLFVIAEHYKVKISKQGRKQEVKRKVYAALADDGILPLESKPSHSEWTEQTIENSIRLKEIELEMQRLKNEAEMQRLKYEAEKHQGDREFELKRAEIRLREIQLGVAVPQPDPAAGQRQPEFDVSRNIRLVPPFSEKDVDKYFTLFERVAMSLKWPKPVWTLLLQCVLVGKARDVYSSLSVDNSLDYDVVKTAILRSYELVPEAYRQKFRRYRKHDDQTFVEFAREKQALFERWCAAQNVTDFDQLKSLVLMEDFKNCLPDRVTTYLNEQKVTDVSQGAVLADEYVLTHKSVFFGEQRFSGFNRPVDRGNSARDNVRVSHASSEGDVTPEPDAKSKAENDIETRDLPMCFYCKKKGHIVANCAVLKRKNAKPVVLVKKRQADNDEFAPFVMKGFVSMGEGGKKIPVNILRDCASSQSFVLEDVLPFSADTSLDADVPVLGFGMENIGVPLHTVNLESELVSGQVTVGIRPQFPVKGVSFLLGNDLAGGKILLTPGMTPVPMQGQDELSQQHPKVFASCAVTRSMSKQSNDDVVDLSDSFLAERGDDSPCLTPAGGGAEQAAIVQPEEVVSLSGEQLISDQKKDTDLSDLWDSAVSEDEVDAMSVGYFLRDGLLMRKWSPLHASGQDDWSSVKQIVVPHRFRKDILTLAHDNPLAGHLGINKTYDRILRHFFWPGLKRDVVQHCKCCHICQVAGKPNQTIPPAPLYPIPVVGEPFERIIIDCVGPLPRTKSGNQFLLTVMCASTRFPEVFPLRNIKTSAIVKALIKFFSLFGLPKVVQSDQGSNFMSRVFSQVMKQLDIKHCHSSAFHAESQGALERFHQTLKSMLRGYCLEFERDWDEGVPLVMFAVREVVQESLGFSPADLVFAHTVRGPLKVLKEKWLQVETERNVLDYVSRFRFRLRRACEMAMQNLKAAQARMKLRFDRKAKGREFSPGDRVLVLLPIPGSSLQARYSGPYLIEKKMGERDYIVATPDRRRKNRLCHVNMLKQYHEKQPVNSVCHIIPDSESSVSPEPPVLPVTFQPGELSSAELPKPVLAAVALSGAEQVSAGLSVALTQGKLSNSEALQTLGSRLAHLTEPQRGDVVHLVESNQSLFLDVPTQTSVLTHDIDVDGARPIKQHPYRVNPDKRRRLKKQVDYMLQHDIAEPSCSAWSSPCLLAEKSNGEDRFCTDFRKVNGVTTPDCYPLPRMEDCIDRVGGASFVTKLDLLKGYWQVPLTDRAREISAFVTPDDFLQYKVMAFGMRNAPATFQRLVNIVLSGLSYCEAYLDDLVVCSNSWADHVLHLTEVFGRLVGANLTVNLGKCEFGQATVTYLGKIVGRGCVRTVQAKVEAIVAFPAPTSRAH